jgi:hypothetical protein
VLRNAASQSFWMNGIPAADGGTPSVIVVHPFQPSPRHELSEQCNGYGIKITCIAGRRLCFEDQEPGQCGRRDKESQNAQGRVDAEKRDVKVSRELSLLSTVHCPVTATR